MGAAFSRARERPFFRLLPWPFRPRSRARRAKRPPASTAEDKSDAIEMEPVPQLTSALKQQDAAAQAQEWCLQFLGGDGPDAGPGHFAPKPKRSTAEASRRQREAEEAEAEEPAGEVEAAALDLEEQVHDEVARLRRLRTAELAGRMGAAADLAMLLGAAELERAQQPTVSANPTITPTLAITMTLTLTLTVTLTRRGRRGARCCRRSALPLLARARAQRRAAERRARARLARAALCSCPHSPPTQRSTRSWRGTAGARGGARLRYRRHPTHEGVAQSACDALAGGWPPCPPRPSRAASRLWWTRCGAAQAPRMCRRRPPRSSRCSGGARPRRARAAARLDTHRCAGGSTHGGGGGGGGGHVRGFAWARAPCRGWPRPSRPSARGRPTGTTRPARAAGRGCRPSACPRLGGVPRVGGGVPEADTSLHRRRPRRRRGERGGGGGAGCVSARRARRRAAVPILCRAVLLTQHGPSAQEALQPSRRAHAATSRA